jgi:hypothetical protein
MLIREKLPPGHLYPQLTQFPANYPDFLAAFRDGQTVDNNTYLTTGNAVQTHLYKVGMVAVRKRSLGWRHRTGSMGRCDPCDWSER